MEEQDTFGVWLRRLRRARDLTQERLALAVGCAAVTIQKIETGSLRPSRQVAERLAVCLHVPAAEQAAFVAAARGLATPEEVTPPPDVRSLTAHRLPVPATALIGRIPFLAAVRAAFAEQTRLLTLVGPPGIGKTRLALEAAWELQGSFAEGAVFVPLATMSDATLVADTIVQALGLERIGNRSAAERLREFLYTCELLLVLDNFEHVGAAAPLVAEILAAAPALRILVTSRVALRISGERELPVPPLDTGKGNWNASAVLPPAVELFVRQARAVRPDFMLNEANAHDVAAICARLDGLPLAIELAAARSRIFTPAALLERLERRLALLTGGPRDLAPRQQTLRAAIDWSYRLLDEQAQTLFARLGVFVGGWTLGAADAVAGDAESANSLSPNPRPRTLHPELLETLVTHSLVQVTDDPTGEPRFTFLETLREYALERLVERGEQELIRRRHAEYMLALAEEANAAIWGADQLAALDRLTLEHDNLRAALIWALEDSGDRMPGVRLAGALGWFWHFRGHWPEGRRWLARALAAQPAESDAQAAGWWAGYARALTMASGLAWAERDYTAAQAYADQALEAVQRCDDASIRGHAAGVRGLVALYVGESDAEPHFAESLAAFRRAEDEAGVALALLRLGLAAWSRQDLDSAEERLGRALALFRRLGAEWGTATTLASMGDVARARSDWAQVAQFYNEALQRYRRLRSNWYIASSLAALSGALGMLGNYEQAARLHGASAVLFEKIGMSLHDLDRVLYVAGQEAARVALGAERYAALHDRGRELPLDTILEQVGI